MVTHSPPRGTPSRDSHLKLAPRLELHLLPGQLRYWFSMNRITTATMTPPITWTATSRRKCRMGIPSFRKDAPQSAP